MKSYTSGYLALDAMSETDARKEPKRTIGSGAARSSAERDSKTGVRSDSNVVINARNLRKVFSKKSDGGVVALDNVDLVVHAGEFVVLLGPSGCGKTTLLRSLAGLETPDSGRIEIGGRVVYSSMPRVDVPPEKRRINMMFQSYALWPHMTVEENVAYPLKSRKDSRKEASVRAQDILRRIGISELAGRYPSELSGGQQQRVALARSLAVDPTVILFDEPLSNVDAKVRERLRVELLAMHQRLGFAAVYVTHDQTEAMQLADFLVVMRNGVIEQQGTPEEIYFRPRVRSVANFIGTSNEFIGTIDSVSADGAKVSTPIGQIEVRARGQAFHRGQSVTLMVRPEDVKFQPYSGSHEGSNSWHGTVQTRMFAGAHTEFVLTLAADVTVQVWCAGSVPLSDAGDSVLVRIPPEALHVIADATFGEEP